MIAFAAYLGTINPTLPPGDSGDLITAASTLGVAHPPGYPLFSMLGYAFTLLPFGSPAFRVNLMSAVADAVAVVVIAILVQLMTLRSSTRPAGGQERLFTAGVAGITGGLFLAFATEFWQYSLVAEVFALNNLFAAAVLLLALRWYDDPGGRRTLWAFFLVSGLASCNQQTIVLLAPGLAMLLIGGILRVRARARASGRAWIGALVRQFAIGVGFLLLGLLPYVYLPLAAMGHPPTLWGDPSTPERFVAVVTRADYGSFSLLGGGQHGSVGENLSAYGGHLLDAFGPAGIVLAVLGTWWLARHRPLVGAAVLLSFATAGPLFLAYANPPLGGLLSGVFARFYILSYVQLAALVGCGAFQVSVWISASLRRIDMASRPRVSVLIGTALAIALTGLAVGPALARKPAVDQSQNEMTINFVRDLLSPLDQGALLLAEGDTAVLGTRYVQYVERYRPDVVVVAVPLLYYQWYIDEMRVQHRDIVIPFDADQVRGKAVTDLLLAANQATRSVYYFGVISEQFPNGYTELRTGFARKFVQSSTPIDAFQFVRANLLSLAAYHFPTRSYPSSSWEYWEANFYGGAAFDLANAYETVNVAQAVTWYREAIALDPNSAASYKNLAILLSANGGAPHEEADLLERYLELAPSDPEAASIKAAIANLRSKAP